MTQNPATQSPRRVPRATYRLQFNEQFRIRDALPLIPYLSSLGISHVYSSPLSAACPHSGHGYDVCDFTRLNPELGTEADLREFISSLHDQGMGLVLDLVPNHMGICGPQNVWWWDVLTYGRDSDFAGFFDIDWESPAVGLRGKVLAPILGDSYERVLELGEFNVLHENGNFLLGYFERRLPLTPLSLPEEFILNRSSPSRLAQALQKLNADHAALDKIIHQQHYLPADWHNGDAELNYRRFFNIHNLAGLRMEDGRVFDETHALLKRWLNAGWVDGLRVDHPDGLRDPDEYLRRLRALAPEAWIVVEKILEPGEELPGSWPVAGTTGYDFLNQVCGLFIDPAGENRLTEFYREFTGETADFAALTRELKRHILQNLLRAEVARLTELLSRIAGEEPETREFTRPQLREVITEFCVSLPVYRTYLRPEQGYIHHTDATLIQEALKIARRDRPELAPEVFHFLGDVLLLIRRGNLESDFVLRLQQLTAPAMAKGVEDTAFYRYNRWTALNEVGGDPGRFGMSADSFHEASHRRNERWPAAMLATSTHDTKRSEDVRARLCVLSEMPAEWIQAVRHWSGVNAPHRTGDWPDRNTEYLFYQTMAGAWPISKERLLAYMEKAARESKQHTTSVAPQVDYEAALHRFVSAVFDDAEFRNDFENFIGAVRPFELHNSLAQILLKLTVPGIPDIYQGCEMREFSLVDPDNRRPVDFPLRQRLLEELKRLSLEQVWERRDEGMPKLFLIQRVLALRARRPELFAAGSPYEPLTARGSKAVHAVSFMRGGGAITIVPRLVIGLGNDWKDTALEIPSGEWRNACTGEMVESGTQPLAELLCKFPVALLWRKEEA
jgi:(1->4)-alpha-D-glucan 1-alpha-D-glucosylmutase